MMVAFVFAFSSLARLKDDVPPSMKTMSFSVSLDASFSLPASSILPLKKLLFSKRSPVRLHPTNVFFDRSRPTILALPSIGFLSSMWNLLPSINGPWMEDFVIEVRAHSQFIIEDIPRGPHGPLGEQPSRYSMTGTVYFFSCWDRHLLLMDVVTSKRPYTITGSHPPSRIG